MSRDGRGPRARWIASVEEMPGCEASGATAEEAAVAIQEAMEQWIADTLERGEPIPAPVSRDVKPGPVELDVPQSLKVALTESAVRQSMELSTFITAVLAGAVGWQPSPDDPESTWLASRMRRLSRAGGPMNGQLLRLTAIGNVVLLALVAIAALVLIYVALKNA
jgi:antitoxin HicB